MKWSETEIEVCNILNGAICSDWNGAGGVSRINVISLNHKFIINGKHSFQRCFQSWRRVNQTTNVTSGNKAIGRILSFHWDSSQTIEDGIITN